jgi:hypothetical protein
MIDEKNRVSKETPVWALFAIVSSWREVISLWENVAIMPFYQ